MLRLQLTTLTVALVVLGSCGARDARAQGNSHSAPLGGRSTLLGGTGVALGGDSAAPFLNPASIALMDQSSLTLASQLIELSYSKIVDFRQPRSGPNSSVQLEDSSVGRLGVRFVPATICYFQKIDQDEAADRPTGHTLSFCIASAEYASFETVADSVSEQFDDLQVDLHTSVRSQWSRTDFNLSWGHFFTDWLALGASAVVQEVSSKLGLNGGALISDQALGGRNSYVVDEKASEWNLRFELGATILVGESIALGLGVRLPSMGFAGSYQGVEILEIAGRGTVQTFSRGSYSAPNPARITLGLGYREGPVELEADLFFYPARSGFLAVEAREETTALDLLGNVDRTSATVERSDDGRFVVNAGLGFRYTFNPTWSVMSGLQTDLSLVDFSDFSDSEDRVAAGRRDYYMASLGAGYNGEIGEFVAGVRGRYGIGESWSTDNFSIPPQPTLVTDREFAVLLVLYGRINVGAVAERIAPRFLKDDDED